MDNTKIEDNKMDNTNEPKQKKPRCEFDGCKKKLSICDMMINKC